MYGRMQSTAGDWGKMDQGPGRSLEERKGKGERFLGLFIGLILVHTSLLAAFIAWGAWNAEQDPLTKESICGASFVDGRTSIALDDQGCCYVLACGYTTVYSTNVSGAWVSTVMDFDDWIIDVSMVVDSNGVVHLAFMKGTFIDRTRGPLWYGSNSGGDWTYDLVDDRDVRCCEIALNPSGDVHIGYSTRGFSWDVESYIYSAMLAVKGSESWDIETVESSYSQSVWMGGIAIDRNAEPMMTYNVGSEIHYASRDDGNWTITVLDEGTSPVLRLDSDDIPHICYTLGDYHTSGTVVHAIEDGGDWLLQVLPLSAAAPISFAMNRAGDLRIVFPDACNHPKTRLFLAEGNIISMTTLALVDTPLEIHQSLVLSTSGDPIVLAILHDFFGFSFDELALFEKDFSAFTFTERLDEGWALTRSGYLAVWVSLEVILLVAFLVTRHLLALRREIRNIRPVLDEEYAYGRAEGEE